MESHSDEFFRRGPQSFLETAYRIAPPIVARHLELEIELLRARLPSTGALLEIACGHGRVLARLARSGTAVWGVDIVPTYLALARAALPNARFTVADASRLPFESARFDVTLCVQASLGLLGEKKVPVLREMRRVTRDRGFIGVVVYSEESIPHRLEWYRRLHAEGLMAEVDPAASTGLVTATADGHRSEAFTREGFEALLREAGLRLPVEPLGTLYYCALAKTQPARLGSFHLL